MDNEILEILDLASKKSIQLFKELLETDCLLISWHTVKLQHQNSDHCSNSEMG